MSLEDYADMSRCWFAPGEDLKAFLVVAEDGGEGVPWFISSRCIARGDLPSYGAATLYLLGRPGVVDPEGLLRRHIGPGMAADNVRTHLPLPNSSSRVYYIVARLEPLPDYPHQYEITDIRRVAPAGIAFESFLEMGPTERSRLLDRVSERVGPPS